MAVSFPYAAHGLQPGSGNSVTVDSSASSTSSRITGNVYSNAGVTCISGLGTPIINGTSYYTSGPDPTCDSSSVPSSTKPAPIINLASWKAAAESGGTTDCSNNNPACTLINQGNYSLGPMKFINGNLTIREGTHVNVTGPIWISGSGSNGKLILDNSDPLRQTGPSLFPAYPIASCGTVIIADNSITINPYTAITASSTNPKNYLILAQDTAVAGNGISIVNNLLAGGPNIYEAVFYSADDNGNGLSDITFSGHIVQLFNASAVGNRVFVTQGASLALGVDLANAKFCGQSNDWIVVRGSYKITK